MARSQLTLFLRSFQALTVGKILIGGYLHKAYILGKALMRFFPDLPVPVVVLETREVFALYLFSHHAFAVIFVMV